MTKPHKWAKEIKAWADGAEIECMRIIDPYSKGWVMTPNPTWSEEFKYRIKPQPKEPQYLYVYQGVSDVWFSSQKYDVSNYIGKIKLENEDGN